MAVKVAPCLAFLGWMEYSSRTMQLPAQREGQKSHTTAGPTGAVDNWAQLDLLQVS